GGEGFLFGGGPGLVEDEAGEADRELGAEAEAGAGDGDGAAVELDEALHQGEADAHAAARHVAALGDLLEGAEDAVETLGGDADAGVADLDLEVIVGDASRERDAAAGVGVLGGVLEEVQ